MSYQNYCCFLDSQLILNRLTSFGRELSVTFQILALHIFVSTDIKFDYFNVHTSDIIVK